MHTFRTIILTIVGCLLGLCLIFFVIGSLNRPARITTTGTPGPTPSSPSVSSDIGHIGDRVEQAGIAITLLAIDRADSRGTSQAPDGMTFILVDVRIENSGRTTETPYNPLYFAIKDGDGVEYAPRLSGATTLLSGTLAHGDTVRGVVAFPVPADQKGFTLTYKPLVIAGGYEPIRFQFE